MHELAKIGILVIAAASAAGCSPKGTPPPAAKPPRLSGLPIEMTVKQRSTTLVPGSDGALRLTLGDITRGRVVASLDDTIEGAVLGSVSLTPGDARTFKLGNETYLLTLKVLNNALVGDDFGTFVVSAGAAAQASSLSEPEKIERLIAIVGSLEGAVFIRNDTEHSPTEAADHLRSKWNVAGSRIATAEDFIEQIATKSSSSGEPYRIRLADGSTVPAGDYLRERLHEIERGR